MYSYHVFYFPFKWSFPEDKDKTFIEQVRLQKIKPSPYSDWETACVPSDADERAELYNEKNYYYKFVHAALYDDYTERSLISHYERKEPKNGEVFYHIHARQNGVDIHYRLRVNSINLNFYSTGVGILSFFLENSETKNPQDILNINQYGRRIFPPFFKDIDYRSEIALSLSLEGLNGLSSRYFENFEGYSTDMTWTPASFICHLIDDLMEGMEILSVIDDRMFVNCWYGNNDLADQFHYNEDKIKEIEKKEKENKKDAQKIKDFLDQRQEQCLSTFMEDDFWYKFLFVDATSVTCMNREMKNDILKNATYKRWQKNGSLFGASRYSLVLLTSESDFAKGVLQVYMRTIYSRMIELVLVQRASMLRFSGEVTEVSRLPKRSTEVTATYIASLYREYIRFVNQIFFREVTSQDQGIELYRLLTKQFDTKHQIKDLDDEIEELNQYVSLLIERKRSEQGNLLSKIATILLPATIVTGFFGMNPLFENGSWGCSLAIQIPVIIIATFFVCMWLKDKKMKS